MNKIIRYANYGNMLDEPTGGWISYSDYLSLLSRYDKLVEAAKREITLRNNRVESSLFGLEEALRDIEGGPTA